jgi:CheY-like chemotaxis protein/anti-sigma regulatory factor (Ser/Thr protein kinase)
MLQSGSLPPERARRIAVSSHIQDHLPPLEGDRRRLHQVLGNILSNAVKFTPDGGRIELDCGVEDDWVRIEVRDTGAGITPEFLPYVFDRFRQADSRSTRRYGGLGLGLAIARHLVEQHGGEIRAHSDGLGCGTTIIVRLPACHAPSFVDRVPARAPVADEPRLDGLVALVVDDHRDSRELLAAVLEDRGAAVVQCERAADALDALSRGRIDLLVADIAMPEIDGYDLVRRLRAQGVRTPAIAVTAYARPEDRQKALAAGYAACCAKPIDTSHVLEIIRALPLSRRGSGRDASFAV